MSLTMDRMCGFLSVVWEQSNTLELPSISWKLKNSAIILNKWQANPYTTLMIKQMTSFSTFFATELDDGCVQMKYERKGARVSACSRYELIAHTVRLSGTARPPPASFTLDLTLVSLETRARRYIVCSSVDPLTWCLVESESFWPLSQGLWFIKHRAQL